MLSMWTAGIILIVTLHFIDKRYVTYVLLDHWLVDSEY